MTDSAAAEERLHLALQTTRQALREAIDEGMEEPKRVETRLQSAINRIRRFFGWG